MNTLILFGQILSSAYLIVAVPLYLYYAVKGEPWRLSDYAPSCVFTAAAFLVAAYLT